MTDIDQIIENVWDTQVLPQFQEAARPLARKILAISSHLWRRDTEVEIEDEYWRWLLRALHQTGLTGDGPDGIGAVCYALYDISQEQWDPIMSRLCYIQSVKASEVLSRFLALVQEGNNNEQ